MLTGFFRKSRNKPLISRIHGTIVAGARQPVFYLEYGAADTFEGRFELVTLHAGLVLHHLETLPDPGRQIAQDLMDAVFANFDAALREIGVGDAALSKKMTRIAEAFLGRNKAYDAALKQADDEALRIALARNALEGNGDSARLAAYTRAAQAHLHAISLEEILAGAALFPDAQRTVASGQ